MQSRGQTTTTTTWSNGTASGAKMTVCGAPFCPPLFVWFSICQIITHTSSPHQPFWKIRPHSTVLQLMSHVPLEIPGFYLRTATFRMIRITYSVKTHSTIDSPALIIQKCIFQFLFAPRLAFLSTFASSCRALHPAPLFATKTLSRRTDGTRNPN